MSYPHVLLDTGKVILIFETMAAIPADKLLELKDAKGITDQGVGVRAIYNGKDHIFSQDRHRAMLNRYLDHVEVCILFRGLYDHPPEVIKGMNVITVVQDYVQRVIEGVKWE